VSAASHELIAEARTYSVRTMGCQMNAHDSERLAGLLEAAGYEPTTRDDYADVVVLNTCAVRENADNKLYGNLGHLAALKRDNPHMQIAVGGCLAQKDREVILEKAPWVDVVFGTHNLDALPILLERSRFEASFLPLCQADANRVTRHGSLFQLAATTPAASALSLPCAERNEIAALKMFSTRYECSLIKA
jgi:tRNA A37 methylthiotransferase MiaB